MPDDKTEITPEHLLQLAFDEEKVLIKLSNLGDKKQKKEKIKSKNNLSDKKKEFPCTLVFTMEKSVIRKEKVTIFICKTGNKKGIYFTSEPINDGNIGDFFDASLREFLIVNKYFSPKEVPYYATAKLMIAQINKKYKTQFEAKLEQRDAVYFLKNNLCNPDKHRINNKYYMPSMFDNSQTLGDKIINWFKNDFSKKYAWE